MAKYSMVIDLERCVGCSACVMACKAEWQVPEGYSRDWVTSIPARGTFPQVESAFYVGLCNHCDEPSCVPACPTGATFRDDEGIVRVDRDLCIGCGMCVESCPYGARYPNPKTEKVDKCDFCRSRIKAGLQPACVQTCITDARIFGDLDDPESRVHQLVHGGFTSRMETPEVQLGPNVYYRGDQDKFDLVIETHPPDPEKLTGPIQSRLWTRVVKPLVFLAIGATFAGQAGAFFYQLFKGEPKVED